MLEETLEEVRNLERQRELVTDKREKARIKQQAINKTEEIYSKIEKNINELFPQIFDEKQSKTLVEIAEGLGAYLAKNGLTTSQIRNVYAQLKEKPKDDEIERLVNMLRPLLAYAARRKKVKPLQRVLDKALQKVTKENYSGFRDFFQAILAYHRYYGGGE